ncbi:MAG TPA: hypothetical protein DCL14_06600 [Ruminococcaceae bacterium]|nr:hypothetical protein [Oscillospiraceae bacterium]
MTKEYGEFLAHHGIKGQKWGVRRFQNPDGTLKNPKGRPESSTWKSKDAGYLSDEELNRRNSRLQRENQYRQLTEPKRTKALKWIQRTASTILVASAIGAMKGTMAGKYKNALTALGSKAGSMIKKFGRINLANLRG